MIEIFMVGGGEYIVNVFNVVVSWMGVGGYKSLIQVIMVMGLVFVVIVLVFNQDWWVWFNWFFGVMFIYMCLMVLCMDVYVMDWVNLSFVFVNVVNVLLGFVFMVSFMSQVGDYFICLVEFVFGLLDDFNYLKNGMIYGVWFMEVMCLLCILDFEFVVNFDEYVW